ncbi:MAG TPA: zinc-binding dehydrogenase, partial [Acidimicrobiales bacterium]|nr:zinc-binding dehydrogenase [Acidimicrobiales bacterium]
WPAVLTTAAVLVETGKPLEMAELAVPPLRTGQVLVAISYSGVCRSQLLEVGGHRGVDAWVPHCLGHEATGVVHEVGPGVTRVKPGATVVLSWLAGAGTEAGGSTYTWDGRTVNAGPVTTFQRHAVVSENRLTPLIEGTDPVAAVMLGCAIPTGFGAVANVAQAQPGETVAVFGVGGVGLCAVIGAVVVGARPVLAVDVSEAKLDRARSLGATRCVLAGEIGQLGEQVRAAADGPIDVAVEATGAPGVMAAALACVRPRGGRAVIVGNAPRGQDMSIDPSQLNQGKRLLGTWGGDAVPERDFPRYQRLLRAGTIDVSSLIERVYALEEVNIALQDLEDGRVFRPVLDMASPR